jgi:hypothetical protein
LLGGYDYVFGGDDYVLDGELTLKGVTRPVSLAATKRAGRAGPRRRRVRGRRSARPASLAMGRLLREPDATVGAVARQAGYGSAFALSIAFKRDTRVSPRNHRLGGTISC